jgi:ribosomal protein S18 acetylase RimI-like enzyme
VTDATWRRLNDPASGLFCRVACDGTTVLGFAICVLHPGTWVTQPICYLEDLYVDPAGRGRGLGRLLLDDLVRLGREKDWARIYWHTEASNAAARLLYDRYARADNFVRYRITLDE